VAPSDELISLLQCLVAVGVTAAIIMAISSRRAPYRRPFPPPPIAETVDRFYAHCQNCGYDLRATPDRCPECGRENKGTRWVGHVEQRERMRQRLIESTQAMTRRVHELEDACRVEDRKS
jgi:hypothetical protein